MSTKHYLINTTPVRRKVLYIRGLDADVLTKFKAKCATHGVTMKDAVEVLIRKYIAGQI
jgi:plasmid stability protein